MKNYKSEEIEKKIEKIETEKYMDLTDVNIGIGIPLSWPSCPSDFFDSFTAMNKLNAHVIRASSGPIQEMRNTITTRALELNCTHLIFLDADMVYPENTLLKLLSHNVDIVGALCFKRWPPFHPTIFTGDKYEMTLIDPWPENELIEVTATGTGCLMIKTEVFEKMPYPWFEFSETPEGGVVGEDVQFCYKAKELDYKIYVDTGLETEHLCQMRVNSNMYKLNKELIKHNQGNFNF